jgi:hypothetical protein
MLDRILSLGPNPKRLSRCLSRPLYEHVDATKVGAYCAFWNGSFVLYRKFSTEVWSGRLTFAQAGSCADRQRSLQGYAEDVMVHLRIRSSKTRQR